MRCYLCGFQDVFLANKSRAIRQKNNTKDSNDAGGLRKANSCFSRRKAKVFLRKDSKRAL
jgi:hypothetical protein